MVLPNQVIAIGGGGDTAQGTKSGGPSGSQASAKAHGGPEDTPIVARSPFDPLQGSNDQHASSSSAVERLGFSGVESSTAPASSHRPGGNGAQWQAEMPGYVQISPGFYKPAPASGVSGMPPQHNYNMQGSNPQGSMGGAHDKFQGGVMGMTQQQPSGVSASVQCGFCHKFGTHASNCPLFYSADHQKALKQRQAEEKARKVWNCQRYVHHVDAPRACVFVFVFVCVCVCECECE